MATGPTANDDVVQLEDDDDHRILVLANDIPGANPIDESTLSIVTPPVHAEDYRVHFSRGTYHIHYEPEDARNDDSIVYSICDTGGQCSTATLFLVKR